MRWRTLLLGCVLLAGCGPVASSQSSIPCAAQTTGLLTAAEVSPNLTKRADNTSSTLGLWNNGDAAYPSFKGDAERILLWSGLYDGTPRSLVNQAWTDLHHSGVAPVDFIPNNGELFSAYPSQVFRVSEASLDFGTEGEAMQWMSAQR